MRAFIPFLFLLFLCAISCHSLRADASACQLVFDKFVKGVTIGVLGKPPGLQGLDGPTLILGNESALGKVLNWLNRSKAGGQLSGLTFQHKYGNLQVEGDDKHVVIVRSLSKQNPVEIPLDKLGQLDSMPNVEVYIQYSKLHGSALLKEMVG